MIAAAAGGESLRQAAASIPSRAKVPWPKPIGSPVLDSLPPVIENSRDVHTNVDKLVEVAGWMAYEELPMPEYHLPLGIGKDNPDETIDFIMVADVVDTAFTDFTTHVKFQVDYAGQHWSDSEAEFACIKRAMDQGFPILDGSYLAQLTRPQMEKIFAGNIEIPMLDEKMELWRQAGALLAAKYNGRFHNFIRTCSPRLYDHGNGMVDRLVVEFPRFNDVSMYDGHEIKLYKLPQLGLWFVYSSLHKSGKFQIEDIHSMTAFADYIVPGRPAPDGHHFLLPRARKNDQYPPADPARQHPGNRNPRPLHLRHRPADRRNQQAPRTRHLKSSFPKLTPASGPTTTPPTGPIT